MYFLVRCKLVTTPWSGVICLGVIRPPFLQADSTIKRCLKCDRCVDFGRARLFLRPCAVLAPDAVARGDDARLVKRSSAIASMLSTARDGDAERGYAPAEIWLADPVTLVILEPFESVDIRRYACLSHNVFHA